MIRGPSARRRRRVPLIGTMDARRLLRAAVTTATWSVARLAREVGVSEETLRKVRQGSRRPSETLLPRLARALRAQARRLTALANRLDRGRDP
jgi:transcriptional regulator with XRE-family HTH domain